MKLPTTLALALLAGAGAALYFAGARLPWESPPSSRSDAGTREALAKLSPEQISKVVIRRDGQDNTVFERTPTGSWVTNGNWPGSTADIEPIVALVSSLSSRFQPLAIESAPATGPSVTVELTTTSGRHVLRLHEPTEGGHRFVGPTYLRLDDRPEVLRLSPGLVGELSRPADQYRQRRVFPAERAGKQANPQERIERLDARELLVQQEGNTPIRLVKGKDGWELLEPSRDHLDPDAGEKLLSAVADLWAEQFVQIDPAAAVLALVPPASPLITICDLECLSPAAAMNRAGLNRSTRSLRVTRHDGTVTTLQLGNRSRGEPPPPPARPGAPPPTPDSYRYARLEGGDVLFEVQDGKLNDIFVTQEQLRDNRLARFTSDDAEEIEIRQGKQMVKLVKEKRDSWRMVSPRPVQADNDKVRDLLQKLSALEAADKDIHSPARKVEIAASVIGAFDRPLLAGLGITAEVLRLSNPVAAYGLGDDGTRIEVLVREKARSEDRDRSKERRISLRLGKSPRENKRVYLQLDGWPRIDAMEDSLSALLDKPAGTYRAKQLFDFAAKDVAQLEIRHVAFSALRPAVGAASGAAAIGADPSSDMVLKRSGDAWTLTTPMSTSADATKANDLLDALGKFKVLAFVADDVPAALLQKEYGLGVPTLRVTVTFTDSKKPPRTLLVGSPRGLEPGYFARAEGSDDVFVLPADLRARLEQPALAYLPSTLWQIASDDDIVYFRIAKAGQDEYGLMRKGEGWEVTGPFTVAAPADVVERLAGAMLSPRAEEYRAFTAGDLKAYGLDKPGVKVTLTTKKGKEHVLWLGADSTTGKPGRYARLGNTGGVFVVADALARAADQSALDFLDRNLLSFDATAATSISRQGAEAFELVKQDDAWKLMKPAEQPADERKVPDLLRQLSSLRADRIEAYKPKDLKPYGLDKPFATITVKLAGETPPERVLLLGREDKVGGRLAMVQGSPVVSALPAAVVRQLLAGAITFRNHDLTRILDADTIKLDAGERKVTFAQPEGTWTVTKPINGEADHEGMVGYFGALSRLRADELVAEKPTTDQLKSYGLEKPIAKWQILNGDEVKLDLLIGGVGDRGRRYARLGEKGLVFLLDEKLSGLATTEYRPRAVWKDNIDPAQVEAVKFGYKKDPFELKKEGAEWQVVGKPEVKLNAATVSDTLSALRDLKLERYVKDDGAQLKLYGLEPPELVLEVTTPSGKQTLQVGGAEGASKRRYARLPSSKHKDVFVLDEAASVKLFGDLATLEKAAGGKAKDF